MSLYRKYRSQKFEDIVGQEHIVQTLRGAISSGQIGHAYIFSGMRGTGKTSIARIFAKAVNCLNPKDGEPCGECSICKETTAGNFLDLIEIDAASNRGIDDIRDLREKIKFAPNVGKFKIYIIDEVHMLTTDAFNALLKTLEEPPAHAIFILATTEIHKIPATIISRCQRFDFHKIDSNKMLDSVTKIAQKEGIKIGDDGLKKIVSLSEGSLRDALSHLDQVSSFSKGGEVSFTLLEDILGVSNEDRLFDFFNLISKKDSKGLFDFINEIVERGRDLENFIKELIRFARRMLIVKIDENSAMDILDATRMKQTVSLFSFDEIISIIETLNGVLKNAKFSFLPQLSLEIALLKFLKPSGRVSTTQENSKGNNDKDTGAHSDIKEKSIEEPAVILDKGENGVGAFLSVLKNEKAMLHAFVQFCDFKISDEKIDITANNQFCLSSISEKNNLLILEKVIREVFGEGRKLCILKPESSNANALKRDMVSEALNVFGGELIE